MDDVTSATEAAGAAQRRAPVQCPPARRERLTGRELLLLQLLAQGYSANQLAVLHGGAPLDVLWDLQRVLTVLGAPTVREAAAEARRRRLIV